ncbi:hypothetical protein Q1695_008475 [Nippostrongylus brasiliensis]|nr:hypothetical protein Q1695_008475 [Nippostrongylus brasiliensis]
MFLFLIAFSAVIWISFRYLGVFLSWVLSVLIRCPLEVGSVGWCRLSDVRVKLPTGLTVHVDVCQLQLFSVLVSKPILLSLCDVRIEGDAQSIAQASKNRAPKPSATVGGKPSLFTRATQMLQYCGLYVSRGHLVLLDALPGCMIHVTVDELLLEAFRSRDGWQLETSCMLARAKAIRRQVTMGHSLLDLGLQFRLSIDIAGGHLKNVSFRIQDPTVELSSGVFDDVFESLWASKEDERAPEMAVAPNEKQRFSIDHRSDLCIETNNCLVKYRSSVGEESRILTLSLRGLSVMKDSGKTHTRIVGLTIEDQRQRLALRTSLLVLCHEKREDGVGIQMTSDSVQTSLSIQDVAWWKMHIDSVLPQITKAIRPSKKTTVPSRSRVPLSLSVEVASIFCDLVDADAFQSTLSVQFFTITKGDRFLEVGVDCFCIAAPSVGTVDATFERHQWGHSVYVGAALLQRNLVNSDVLVGIDDCKIEWSDNLANQVSKLLSVFATKNVRETRSSVPEPPFNVKLQMKRAALFSLAKETSYIVFLCDELAAESTSPRDFVVSAQKIRLISGVICDRSVSLLDLYGIEKYVPESVEDVDQAYRCWNQSENDARKNRKRTAFNEKRARQPQLCGETTILCVSFEHLTPSIRNLTFSSGTQLYLVWSPLLHRVLYHMIKVARSTFAQPATDRKPSESKELQFRMLTNHPIELVMELPRHHRMVWTIPSLTFDYSLGRLTAVSPNLVINMDGFDIVTAIDVCITRRVSDTQMDSFRRGFDNCVTLANKVWTWSAASFIFYLPFEFNFAQVFDEFINCIKWIKLVHGLKKEPFTQGAPLPADFRLVFKEARIELEDDYFENLLQMSHELKEDEVYECERRRQMLSDRLLALRKANPLLPQTRIDELFALLLEKNSAIYVERWNKAGSAKRPLFVSKWTDWDLRAFADESFHSSRKCVDLMRELDPSSSYPAEGLQFSTLWGRAVELDMGEWCVNFKDYPIPYLLTKDIHFFGILVGAEEFEEGGRSLRECEVPLPFPWETHTVKRNMAPLKFYYDMQCESADYQATYGPCWEPCLSMVVTTMLASPDPYNTTETVEMCWDDFGLDWALGEIRIRSGLRVFMRTASRYDDSRILFLPDLRLRVVLDWICSGDPHDHHAVTVCAPHRLPHYSTDHDSYRAFRSSSLDLSLSFDVAAGAENGETGDRLPHVLLYANTFRCIEFLLNTLTMKNQNVRKGRLFGTPSHPKPQLGKHFRNVQVSLNFPKFYITYWMSHSSDYGFRVISDGLNLLASLRLTLQADTETGITRRRNYVWIPQHVSATLWGTQVHVYSDGHSPSVDGLSSSDEETFLLGLTRVSYVRENNRGRDSTQHRLTVHDLKASWTAQNRNACISIADGVHRAHMLRRILSNDALKILKLHVEEDTQSSSTCPSSVDQSALKDEKGHRRGFSMSDHNQSLLNQLVGEASTKLVAHCEQTGDLPTDSLLGTLQCTSDDVRNINWQIDLLNSQLVLKGCERAGFVLLTAARASVTQKVHRCVWRNGQLLGKKSWSSIISGMQYFAPISCTNGRAVKSFRWLTREVIEEKTPTGVVGDPYLHPYIGAGEAVGGVVEPEEPSEKVQLQRIVSRCSCEIYFCYFSEELKTDALEETGVPKIEQENSLGGDETGVDCFTLKHNMLEASSNSEQYEMMVDIVNNLVLYVDPKKKDLAERRRKLRFACQMTEMNEIREKIVEQQCALREIVSVVRSLERQLFYLDAQSNGNIDEQRRKEIVDEMEETKAKQLEVSDKLATYISCYKQRQVEATRATGCSRLEEDETLAAVARRFEVCFEDCIWKLTEPDGQIAIAQIQIRNFLYTRTIRIDSSGEHLFEVGTIRVTNLLPDTIYRDTLHRDERVQTRQPSIRLMVRDMAPVGGICVKELFEVNISPMVAQLTYRFFEKMMLYFFPGRNIHKEDNLDSVDEGTPKFSFTRRLAGTLSMRSNRSIQIDRKTSSNSGKGVAGKQPLEAELTDIDKMRERADNNNFFVYIKIPEVPFVVSYKGNKDKNIEDVDRFSFLFPLCEFHERNWTWLDVALAVKQRCKRVLLQQFMRQKLLRNRLTGGPETVEGISEEDKKRIALGSVQASTIEKKKKK